MNKYNRVSPMKIIMIVVAVLLVLAAAFLAIFIYSDGLKQETMSLDVDNSFLFGNCQGDVNDVELTEEMMSVKAMLNYNGELSRISSDYYLGLLQKGKQERTIALYKALLYAYNNNYNFISVPSAIYNEDTMVKAVYYANCDLPIMDLNTEIGSAESSITMANGDVSKRYYIYMPTGSQNHINFKKMAIQAAEKVIKGMPETVQSDMEKVEYIHDWLVSNVRFTTDEGYDARNPNYIYDALVGRGSNSDGIARAYTLLLNLSGVEGFTVYRPDGEGKLAHTWNVIKADGNYYQSDATHDANVFSLGLGNLKMHLALSASAMGNGDYHKVIREATPPCTNTGRDNDYIDAVVPGTDAAYKNAEGMIALRNKLDGGASYVTLRCPPFAKGNWGENFKVISIWFADSKVSFKVSNAGGQCCVLYVK